MRTRFLIALLLLSLVLAGTALAQSDSGVVELTILHTSDEHGWLQPYTPYSTNVSQGGAANVGGWWAEVEAYDPASTIILSGGDNWTGPSISTWFYGEPVVEVMNLLGYDASAIGNHEFDFGLEVMAARFAEAGYPYLSANIRDDATGDPAPFAQPYALFERQGVTVAVIGLTSTRTPSVTHPQNVEGLGFMDYSSALDTYLPEVEAAGADVVIILAHACTTEVGYLARQYGDQIDAILGGDCHQLGGQTVNSVPVLGPGWAWRSYTRLTLAYDPAVGDVTASDFAFVNVEYNTHSGSNPVTPDADVAAVVQTWQDETDAQLDREIGYTSDGLRDRGAALTNLVTDAWLWGYPGADVAITNTGGFRQPIDAGPVTLADVVAVLPFENRIYDVTLTGEQLALNLACCGGAVGGITYTRAGTRVEIAFLDGRAFDPEAEYHVLVNDFMYFGGDGYLFSEQDAPAYDTGINWRQPVIDYLIALGTNADDPLENYLDTESRGR